jgi:hypothetical protein
MADPPYLGTGHVVPGLQDPKVPEPPRTHTIHIPTETAEKPLTYAITANFGMVVSSRIKGCDANKT